MADSACRFGPDDRVRYAYGEMPADQADSFAAHLQDCVACRREVEELRLAADLCASLRAAEMPEPRWTGDGGFLASAKRPGLFSRPWFWAPAALAGATALVLLLLVLAGSPPVPSPAPGPGLAPTPDRPSPNPAEMVDPPTTIALRQIAAEGQVQFTSAGSPKAMPLTALATLHRGDELHTSSAGQVTLELTDGSRIDLLSRSRLQLLQAGPGGDSFRLAAGAVACQVAPRQAQRPFQVETARGVVTVVGTRFGVRVHGDGTVEVGVEEGRVSVAPSAAGGGPVILQAGQQLALTSAAAPSHARPLGADLRAWLSTEEPATATDRPANPAERAKIDPGRGQRRPVRPPHAAGSPADPGRPAREDDGSLEALVARLHQDTNWIFDDLRSDMERGRFDLVLHKLQNYLQDPDSPRRDEATFLKAVCLEELGRPREAMQSYRRYLTDWPGGDRTAEARRAMRRIRRGR